jgi:peptidoglycan/LPS O-acetylase OafA/YrhL
MAHFGTHGVQLVFLVSAFTMCHLWTLRRAEPDPARRFYPRRVARIAPLFWLAMAWLAKRVLGSLGLQGFVALLALTLATSHGLARLAHAWVERPVQDWVNARLAAGAPAAG